MAKVLLADDDRSIRTVLEHAFTRAGHEVLAVGDLDSLIQEVRNGSGDVVVTDVLMPGSRNGQTGLDLIPKIREERGDLPVIVISAQSTLMTAVRAAEAGAFDYLPKPFDLDVLIGCVGRALEQAGVPPVQEMPKPAAAPLIGTSPAMQEIYRMLARVVATDLTVMIHGESGTGKELVAHALHDLSPRRAKPFVALNMAAIPRELVESELFGHEKGAFTGATARKSGTFEQAGGGTVFLDEIGDMPLEAQTRLLRVLQQGEFVPVGGTRPVHTEARIVCATHRDMAELVRRGSFRQDLFYRLNVVPVALPPLRERREDIPSLAEHFLKNANARGLPQKQLTDEAVNALSAYRWPGNIRELENLIYRLCALVAGQMIEAGDVRGHLQEDAAAPEGRETMQGMAMEEILRAHLKRYFAAHEGALPPAGLYERILPLLERPLIEETLKATAGNQLKAAMLLGINRNTLRKRMQELGIELALRRREEA